MNRDKSHQGQTLAEYALILALLAAAAILSLRLLGVSVGEVFAAIVAALGGDPCEFYVDTDFDGSLDDWLPLTYGYWHGDMAAEDGMLAADSASAMILDGFSGEDYVIDVGDVTLTQVHNSWQGYGVMFRSSKNDNGTMNGYMLEIEKLHSGDPGRLYFSKWVNGNQVPSEASLTLGQDFDWANPPRMQIAVEGDTFTAYMDGEEALQWQDDTYTDGSVGVAANYGSRMTMDSLSVGTSTCAE